MALIPQGMAHGGVWSQHSKYKIRVIIELGKVGVYDSLFFNFSLFQSGCFLLFSVCFCLGRLAAIWSIGRRSCLS